MIFSPKFDRIATQAGSESAKSSARNTEKLPSGQPPFIDAIPNAAKV